MAKDKEETATMTVPLSMARLLRRLDALPDGRYTFVITKSDGEMADCTEMGSGKVEVLNH